MARRDNALAVTGPLVKSIVFAVVGICILSVLWIQFGQISFSKSKTYSAVFTDSAGIQPASGVTAKGVQVGRVDSVGVYHNTQALVTFTVDASVPMTTTTRARIRYANLTGDQFLDLTPAPGAPAGTPLADGAVIPAARTSPSLDIDELLNGFNPLLQGLQPAQVNQLSGELVSVLQGEGGTINSVLAHAASFSGSLAQQDHVIGGVINSFNTVIGHLDEHSQELSHTVTRAASLVHTVNDDRASLLDGLNKSNHLASGVADIAEALRQGHNTFQQVGRVTGILGRQKDELNRVLGLLPGSYLRLGRIGDQGSSYKIQICAVRLRLTGPDGQPYYTPQIGPSDNSRLCSKDNVAPLQNGYPTNIHGPDGRPAPQDSQAVTQGANKQGHVTPHDVNLGPPNGPNRTEPAGR